MHPGWRQEALLAACRAAGVHVTAYAPLGRGALLAAPAARPKCEPVEAFLSTLYASESVLLTLYSVKKCLIDSI